MQMKSAEKKKCLSHKEVARQTSQSVKLKAHVYSKKKTHMLWAETPQFSSNNETEKTELKEKPFRNTLFTKNIVSMAAREKKRFCIRKKYTVA